jgi:tRNA pseudouridine38-40 synthase
MGERRNFRVVLSYDGTEFSGWQVQPGLVTVQGELQAALGRICGETPLPQGSGRTDAGVHALGQVASFELESPIPAGNLHRALNRTLPEAVRVLSVEPMPEGFHARHSAVGKWYEYRLFQGEICSPFAARYVWAVQWRLDLERMQRAAAMMVGEQDFTSFAATDADKSQREDRVDGRDSVGVNPVKRIFSSEWSWWEPDVMVYRVHGSGFLHHMVRNMVGTFVDVGRGALEPEAMAEILAAKQRRAAGPTAPASGLFLLRVDY